MLCGLEQRKDRQGTVRAQQCWPTWASCAVTSTQLWLFFSKTVCDLPNQCVIRNIIWPDISFGNAVINLLALSATCKATSYITVMQCLVMEGQFYASQGHLSAKSRDKRVQEVDVFIISSSGSLALPVIPLFYFLSLSLSHLPIQKKKQPKKTP